MLDANTLLGFLYGGIAVGFFSALLVNSIGRGIAAFGSLPAISFIAGLATSGTNVTSTNLGPFLVTTLTAFVPIVYTGVGEAVGTVIGSTVRSVISRR